MNNRTSKREILLPLQGIRAIAFLGIFAAHSSVFSLGEWGVSIFFVLSGFLMVYSYYDKTIEFDLRSSICFAAKKITKLYPLHLFMTVLLILLAVVGKSISNTEHLAVKILSQVTLIQVWFPHSNYYFSLNGVAWYLAVTAALYAIFPVLLKWIQKFRTAVEAVRCISVIFLLQIVIGFVGGMIIVPEIISDNFVKWLTYVCPLYRLGDFLIGCCLGYLFLHSKPSNQTIKATIVELAAVLANLLAVMVFIRSYGTRFGECYRYCTLYTLPSVLTIYTFAKGKGLLSKILALKPALYLGNLSAYTFLIHHVVIKLLKCPLSNVIGNKVVSAFLMLVITVLISECYRYVENKCKSFGKISVSE